MSTNRKRCGISLAGRRRGSGTPAGTRPGGWYFPAASRGFEIYRKKPARSHAMSTYHTGFVFADGISWRDWKFLMPCAGNLKVGKRADWWKTGCGRVRQRTSLETIHSKCTFVTPSRSANNDILDSALPQGSQPKPSQEVVRLVPARRLQWR